MSSNCSNIQKRNCSKEKKPLSLKGTKRICIPIDNQTYSKIIYDAKLFREYLDGMNIKYPQIFPSGINQSYKLHDILPESQKMKDIRLRRIAYNGEIFTIAPSFILPYMMGYTEDVEKALFLRGFGVPYWGITYLYGKNDMYWYRVENHFGRNSIVGTTVKDPKNLPQDLIADEKHSWENGENIYIATTVANGCVLGASVAANADTDSLKEAYGNFKNEAQNLSPDYSPKTVNTDGWPATQSAWQKLFYTITIILCFLHSFLKIRTRCKHMKESFQELSKKVWDTYHSDDKATFRENINSLKAWAIKTIKEGVGLDAILKLCSKVNDFVKAYDYPSAYRTSNMLDRIMDQQDRYIYSCKYFHGHILSAEYNVRAWALLYNFRPYCPRSKISAKFKSPAHKLNGFTYNDNWLQNLIVSASMGGFRR
jgi:hypothetical protein